MRKTEPRGFCSRHFEKSYFRKLPEVNASSLARSAPAGGAVRAFAGCTQPEIATITGHLLRDVAAIVDAHYLSRDPDRSNQQGEKALQDPWWVIQDSNL
jgi:hypothetical protein